MNEFSRTISLEDAERMSGPLHFGLMLKPLGSLCNLDCNYCYYLDKSDIYGGTEPRMSLDLLETVTEKYIRSNEAPEMQFDWHGGEPLLMGLDFYRKAVEFQQKYAGGKTIRNTIQTNGTLINHEWASFFRDNGFLVGISIDGPEDIHDRYRKDKGRKPTFARVMKGIETLYRNGVEYNTLSTVNKASEKRGLEVYTFLKSLGTRFMQFNPVVEHIKYPLRSDGKPDKGARPYIVSPYEEDASVAPWSVSSVAYGRFLTDIFDHWVRKDVGRYFVNHFDATLAKWCGVKPGICTYGEVCGYNTVIEHNGDVYPCDHFVYPQYKLGNIAENTFNEMLKSPSHVEFGIGKRNSLPVKCQRCRWLHICAGECPKHRFSKTEAGDTGLNILCDGISLYLSHVAPYMDKMKEYIIAGKPPAEIMKNLQTR